MPATYPSPLIVEREMPRAKLGARQHIVDVYASEINKIASVWRVFDDGVLDYKPHVRSASVGEIFKHELLSGRRFFAQFLGLPEPVAASVVPAPIAVDACVARLGELARARLPHLAEADERWWEERVSFFDVERPRVWVFWRRVLHSAHH